MSHATRDEKFDFRILLWKGLIVGPQVGLFVETVETGWDRTVGVDDFFVGVGYVVT